MQQQQAVFQLNRMLGGKEDRHGMRSEDFVRQIKGANHEKRMRLAFGARVFNSIHLYRVSKPYGIIILQKGDRVTTIEVVDFITMDLG